MEKEVKITIKYIPTALPPNTNPSYNVLAIDINEKHFEETLREDINVSLVKLIREGKKSEVMVMKKYQELQSDLGEILQGIQG